MAAAENRTCIITLLRSDFRLHASLSLFFRERFVFFNKPIEYEDIHLKIT